MMIYQDFIESKALVDVPTGIEPPPLNSNLYEFQHDIVTCTTARPRLHIC